MPNFRVLPPRTRATKTLAGYFGPIGDRKEEIRITLNSIGVSASSFDETIGRTRLNIQLVQRVSDYLAGATTFRNEKVKFDALTIEGDGVQLVKSVPTNENNNPTAKWTNLVIRPTSSNASTVTTFGATYIMGFQLYKETVNGSNANWCCLEPSTNDNPWVLPQTWVISLR